MMRSSLSGFTLMEVLIAVTIGAIIAGMGLPVTLNLYRSYILQAEQNTLVTLLEQARSAAFANVGGVNHGVAKTATTLVGYQGSSYATRDPTKDIIFGRADSVVITGPPEVTFQALSATLPSDATYTLSNTTGGQVITINTEGRVDW